MVSSTVEIWCDGSSISNPGPSGLAYIIKYYEEKEGDIPIAKEITFSQGFRYSTNNRMEIMAGIYALKKVLSLVEDGTLSEIHQINLASDSEYFCKAVNQNWLVKWQGNNWMTSGFGNKKPSPVKNKDLWEQVVDIQAQLKAKNITLVMTHVPGHTGIENNERCDDMARTAANGSEQIKDDAYESAPKDFSYRK